MAATTIPIHAAHARSPAFEYLSTKKDELVGWARKFSLFPYPFVTACCAMEFMSVSSTPYDTDRFGAALPRFSPRQSDLLMVVGTLTHKQAPILLKVYEQMCEPKWVMAFGACATSGGFYQNYAAVAGNRQDHPGGHLRPRLSAAAGDGHRRHHDAAGPDRPVAASHRQRQVLIMSRADLRPSCSSNFAPATGEFAVSHGTLVIALRAGRAAAHRAAAQERIRIRSVARRDGGRLARAGAAVRGRSTTSTRRRTGSGSG